MAYDLKFRLNYGEIHRNIHLLNTKGLGSMANLAIQAASDFAQAGAIIGNINPANENQYVSKKRVVCW